VSILVCSGEHSSINLLISKTNFFVSGLAVALTLKTISGPIASTKFSSANRRTSQKLNLVPLTGG